MSTSSAVRASRSTPGLTPTLRQSCRDAVGAEDLVQLRLVVALPLAEPPQHDDARQEEFAAGQLPAPHGADGDAPGRDDPAPEVGTGLTIDLRDGGVENRALAEHRATTHPSALGHHRAAADHDVVLDHDRHGVRGLEHATDPDATGQVD